jgi:hypothetical protein
MRRLTAYKSPQKQLHLATLNCGRLDKPQHEADLLRRIGRDTAADWHRDAACREPYFMPDGILFDSTDTRRQILAPGH